MKQNKKIHGFKVPEDYFKGLETRFEDALKADSLPKKSGFEVPLCYFESFEPRLQEKLRFVATPDVKKPKVISFPYVKHLSYVAAVAAFALIIFTLMPKENTLDKQFDTLPFANIETYIEEGNLDYTSHEVAQILRDNNISAFSINNNNIQEETMADYLLENLDDNSLLNY